MSPSDATARPYTAARGTWVTDVQPTDQVRALVTGEAATSASRATRRRNKEEGSPWTPFAQYHEAAQYTSGADAACAELPESKGRIALLPLDVSRPGACENWRRSGQAAAAYPVGVGLVAMERLAEIDNQHRADAQLSDAAKKAPALN